MASDITFSSFAGGEVSKAFYGRSDLPAYFASARALENVIIAETGAAAGRGGSYYVFGAKDNGNRSLLVPFQFNEEQAYIIEFADGAIRFYRNRGVILESELTITDITQADPGVVTVSHNLTSGRMVYFSDVGGMTELNGNFYLVEHILGSAKNISNIDRSNPALITFAGGHGFIGGQNVYIESVGGMTEVNDLFFELADVVYGQSTITAISQANPAVVTVSSEHSLEDGDTVYIEGVVGMTEVNNLRFTVSPHYSSTVNVSAATKANPCVITTSSDHGFDHGDRVLLESLGGMTELNDNEYTIARNLQSAVGTYFISLSGTNPVAITTFSSHGYSTGDFVYITGLANATGLNGRQFTITVTSTSRFTLDGTVSSDYGSGFYYEFSGSAQRVDKDKFQLVGIDSTSYTTYTSGGTAKENYLDQFELDSTDSTGYTAYTSGGSADEVDANDFYLNNVNSFIYGTYTSGGTAKGIDPTQFNLQDLDGNDLDTTGFTAYTSGGTIEPVHEIPSPYTAAELFDDDGLPRLQFSQSNDFIFLAHPDHPPMQLTRTGHADWQLSAFPNEEGPFLDENITDTLVYIGSGDSPAQNSIVNLYSSTPIFEDGHTGSLFMLRLPDTEGFTPWTTGEAYALNDEVISNDVFYRCVDAGTSGTEVPSHDIGTAWDGPDESTNCKWQYIHNGRGIVLITSIVTSQHAIGTVISEVPASLVGIDGATYRWNEAAWSEKQGYPRSVELHEGRLCWGGTTEEPLEMDFSSAVNLFNYNPVEPNGVVTRATAFRRVIDSGNPIRWMKTTEKGLVVGTLGANWIVATEGVTQSFGPDTAVARQFASNGCAPIPAVRAGDSIVAVDRARRNLRDIQFTIERQSFINTGRNLKANHILLQGAKQLAYTDEPFKVVWCLLGDGTLAGLTFNNEADARIFAWHRHGLAGTGVEIESIAVIPSQNADVDDLWMCVKRTIDGNTVRYIEYLKRPADIGDDFVDGMYLDCGLTYDGSPATSFSGLLHLAGETIDVLADGILIEDKTVSATGTLTLATAASVVHFGFYTNRVLETINLEVVSDRINTKMRKKRISLAQLDMVESYGAYVGTNSDDMDRIDFDVETGQSTPIDFTGSIYENVNDTAELVKFLRVEQRTPHPFFVNSISCRVEISDD